jgi:hypothetical protein
VVAGVAATMQEFSMELMVLDLFVARRLDFHHADGELVLVVVVVQKFLKDF